jgi:hypothetical protein
VHQAGFIYFSHPALHNGAIFSVMTCGRFAGTQSYILRLRSSGRLLRVFEGAAFFVSNRSGDKYLVSTLSQSDNLSQRVIGVIASRNATVLLLERTMIG